MKGATALKKIRARAKQLKKKSPGAKYQNLMKKAGAEYRAGKLKTRKKSSSRKRKPAKRKGVARKKTFARPRKVVRRKDNVTIILDAAKKPRKRRTYRRLRTKKGAFRGYRRIGKKGNGFMWLVLGAAALFGIVYIVNNQKQRVQYIPTGNVNRDNTASNILAYAQAANLSLAAITKLIAQINASDDNQVQNIYDVIKTDPGSFENVAGVGYVQDGFARPAMGY